MGIDFRDVSPVADTLVTIPVEDRRLMGRGFAQANVVLERLYSLVLFDLISNEALEEPALDPAGRTTACEYFFRVPPKVHEMHEPFATQITPTQNGGRFIESHGSLIKEIRLQGTTGFRPDASARRTVDQRNVQTRTEEATGYDDLIFLKNMFRYYSDLKHDLESASTVAMLWRNIKDGEYWVVEPTDFRVSQSSSSPLTYEYDIQLKTVSRLSLTYKLVPDPIQPLMSQRSFQSRLNHYTTELTNAFTTLSNNINAIRRVGVDAVNTVLRPILAVLNGLSSLKHAGQRLVNFVTADLINVAINVWDAYERVLTNNDGLNPQNIVANTLKRVGRLAARILREDIFRKSTHSGVEARKRRLADAYKVAGTPQLPSRQPARGSSGAFVGDQNFTSNVIQDYVRDGEDIRSLAARLLGSRAKWHSIVVLNDLRAPYISAEGGSGILKPGDPVLVPARRGVRSDEMTQPNRSPDSQEQSATNRTGPAVDAYGRDLRLLSTEVSPDVELTDLAVSQRGDIDTIAGIANVDQAIRLKFATEQGELTVHPTYGARYPIGSRATPSAFSTFRINVESTLRSDARISRINQLSFAAEGDVLRINAKLRLVNQSDELVTSLEL